jgi:hypothetical protein
MKRFPWILILAWATLLPTMFGCTTPGPPPVDVDAQAKAKVEAFKKLADALPKDPNGMDARGALEEFRNYSLDLKTNREHAEEIVKIYNQRIKGKYQGETAQEAQSEVAAIQNGLKATK